MKSRVRWWVAALLTALAGAQAWAYVQMARGLADFEEREQPWLQTQIGGWWLWPWGAGWLREVRLQPQDWYNAQWQLPLFYRLGITRLDFRRSLADSSLLHVRLRGVQVPLADAWGWTIAFGQPGDPLAHPPDLHALGYAELLADADLDLRFRPEVRSLHLAGTITVNGFGVFTTDCELDAGAELLADDSSRIALRRCRLRYEDNGALAAMQKSMGQRLNLSPAQLGRLLDARFGAWARQHRVGLTRPSRAAVSAFLQQPRRLEIEADPPVLLPLYKVRAAPPESWFSALGLSLSVPDGPIRPQ